MSSKLRLDGVVQARAEVAEKCSLLDMNILGWLKTREGMAPSINCECFRKAETEKERERGQR